MASDGSGWSLEPGSGRRIDGKCRQGIVELVQKRGQMWGWTFCPDVRDIFGQRENFLFLDGIKRLCKSTGLLIHRRI